MQVAAAQTTLTAAQAEVERLGFESFVLSVDIQKTQTKLASAEADTKASAVLLYKRPDSASVTNLIGSTQGSGSLVEAKQYLKHVSEKRRNDLTRAQRLRNTLETQKNELDAQKEQADGARAQAEASKNEIDVAVREAAGGARRGGVGAGELRGICGRALRRGRRPRGGEGEGRRRDPCDSCRVHHE